MSEPIDANRYKWKVQSQHKGNIYEVNKIIRPYRTVVNDSADKYKDYDQRLQKTYSREVLTTRPNPIEGIYSTESKLGNKLLEMEEKLNVGDTFQIHTDKGEHKSYKVIMKELITEKEGS